MFKALIDWYLRTLGTGGFPLVALLMAIESSIVPLPSEFVIPPAAHLAWTSDKFSLFGVQFTGWSAQIGLVIAGAIGSLALMAMALTVLIGITLGLVAGFARGVVEIVIMRLMDIILTLPSLLLAIVIVAILGPGLMNAMLAVAVVVLPHYVRITRAAVITETSKDYVTAARANGASRLRLMFSEVLPNCAAPLIVQASLGVSTAILLFTKTNSGGTDYVWFYDVDADGMSLDDKRTELLPPEKLGPVPRTALIADDHAKNNLPDILARWTQRDRAERQNPRTAQSFCVPKADIAAQGYDLSLNRYKEVVHAEVAHRPPGEILKALGQLEAEIQQGMKELEGMLR